MKSHVCSPIPQLAEIQLDLKISMAAKRGKLQ